jgi:TPR repeat protein
MSGFAKGYLYDRGLGCSENKAAAASWYRKAADGGDPLGANNMADMLFER